MTKILYGFSIFMFASVWSSTEWSLLDAELPRGQARFLEEENDCTQEGPPVGSYLERYMRGVQTQSEAKEQSSVKVPQGTACHLSKKERAQKESYLGRHMMPPKRSDREWAVTQARCLFEGYANLGDLYVRRKLTTLAIEAYQIALHEGKMYVSAKSLANVRGSLEKLLPAKTR